MNYQRETVAIEGTNMADIADALMVLSDFPRDSALVRINNIYNVGGSRKCAASFHKESMEKAGWSVMEAVKCVGPNIIVGKVYVMPEERHLKPVDEYEIEFDTEKVDPSLIGRIEGYLNRN